jgi:hypothetical protein
MTINCFGMASNGLKVRTEQQRWAQYTWDTGVWHYHPLPKRKTTEVTKEQHEDGRLVECKFLFFFFLESMFVVTVYFSDSVFQYWYLPRYENAHISII